MGAVDTTYTFTATDTITSTKMNNIIDQTTITSDAITGTTLEVASGKLKVRAAGITSNEMATGSVTATAIADGSVTSAKLATGGPTWTGSTGTIIIPQSQLELGTGNQTSTASLIDFHSVYPSTDYEARIVRYAGTNGGLTIQNTGSGGILLDSPNGVDFASAKMPNPVGTAPIYGCRAWVNFTGSGAVTVRASGNVSSVQDNGTGNYTVNFTTHMPDASFSAVVTSGRDASNQDMCQTIVLPSSGASVQVLLSQTNTSTTRDDSNVVCVSVFR